LITVARRTCATTVTPILNRTRRSSISAGRSGLSFTFRATSSAKVFTAASTPPISEQVLVGVVEERKKNRSRRLVFFVKCYAVRSQNSSLTWPFHSPQQLRASKHRV